MCEYANKVCLVNVVVGQIVDVFVVLDNQESWPGVSISPVLLPVTGWIWSINIHKPAIVIVTSSIGVVDKESTVNAGMTSNAEKKKKKYIGLDRI